METLLERTMGLLVQQYKGSDKLNKLFVALMDPTNRLEQLWALLKLRVHIDHASGAQLDTIGELVGLKRPITEEDPAIIFSFDSPSEQGRGFGGIGRGDVGGLFAGLSPIETGVLDDIRYRARIRAKIMRNVTRCTINDMVAFVSYVLGVNTTVLNGIGYIDLNIEAPLTPYEQNVLASIFPLPAGVRLRIRSYSLGGDGFGFVGNSNSTGFGGVGIEQDGSGFGGLF